MAHAAEKKAAARAAYVFDRLPAADAAAAAGVPEATFRNWKNSARRAGDDWDHARAASALSARGTEEIVQSVLHEYLLQHQATVAQLNADQDVNALQKAEVLARLADSFHKHVSAVGRLSPKLSRKAVALDVIDALLEYTRAHYPRHGAALVEVLEPFAAHLEGMLA